MIYEFKFPDVGEGVHEGKVLKYLFNLGDTINPGDVIAVVETDKVVAEIPSPRAGKIKKFGVDVGEVIEVGKILAYIETEEKNYEANKKENVSVENNINKTSESEENAGVVGELELAGNDIMPSGKEGLQSEKQAENKKNQGRILATPVARKLAVDKGINLKLVHGTGPLGRIMKKDIIKYNNENKSTFTKSNETANTLLSTDIQNIEKIELSILRRTIIKNMEDSAKIPSATLHEICIIDELKRFRDSVNEGRQERISLQAILMKAIAEAIKRHKIVNSSLNKIDNEIIIHKNINIGFATQTNDGLVVPVVKYAERKSIEEINSEMKNLISKAKNKSLTLQDLRGGTISITNYGPFGGLFGNPLILTPQAAILGFGRIHQAPVVKDDKVLVAWVLPISFVFDHRIIDGVPAADFIFLLKEYLQNPLKLLTVLT